MSFELISQGLKKHFSYMYLPSRKKEIDIRMTQNVDLPIKSV